MHETKNVNKDKLKQTYIKETFTRYLKDNDVNIIIQSKQLKI